MAWESGFFNSVNGDRLYNADDFNTFLEGLITNGIFASVGDKLAVSPKSGLSVQVGTGKGWFSNRWVKNTSPLTVTLQSPDVTLNRYAAICIRVDTLNSRKAEIYVKYSDMAINPVKPVMTRTESINEYCLAYVYIGAGVTEIKASSITDTRNDKGMCGWVTGLIEQIDINTIYTQFTAQSQEWYATRKSDMDTWLRELQDSINSNTETMLVNAVPKELDVLISGADWAESDGAYTATKDITGMTATKTVIVTVAESSVELAYTAQIRATAQGVGKLTFTAKNKPSGAVKMRVCYFGK